MADYYLCIGRPVKNVIIEEQKLGQERVFICDAQGKTSDDYATRFMPQNAENKDYQLQRVTSEFSVDLERLVNELPPEEATSERSNGSCYARGDLVQFRDLYGSRLRWAEIFSPYVLTSVRQISVADVDLICDRLSKENLRAKSVRAGVVGRYQPDLDALKQDYNLKKRELEGKYHQELEGVTPAASLLDIVKEL